MAGWEVRLHDPARARRVRLFAMLLVLCIPLAFYAGSLWQQQRQPAMQVEPASVAVRDEQLQREVDELRQRLVVLSSAEKVSQQANEQSRLSIKLLEEQIYKQQQDLAFYKGVLAPASRREGLRVKTFELQATDKPEHFRYKILLSRVGKGETPLEGQLQQIAFEIDIGLARGGFATPQALGLALNWLRSTPNLLRIRGLMGYDAHLAHTPFWVNQDTAFAQSAARYQAFIASAAAFSELWSAQPLLNGAGSLTYALHTRLATPLKEVAVGSALLKPSDFDSPLLGDLQAALWIASPVLKALPGQLPFLDSTQPLLQRWDRNRQQTYYLYGGQWPATPVSPAGLSYDALYGRSANQERLIGSLGTGLQVDDWVFLRPQRSEGLFELFNQLVLLRNGRLVGSWAAHDRA